jgi:GT2 family glycosyltransferase/Flp pilus assembly protein TadD
VPFEILVVDDASTDQTPRFLRESASIDPRLRSVRNDTNKGFARSCNHGARTAVGKYLLFLNNDTEVQPGWFSPLLTTLEENPDIGIVGPKLVFSDGSIQHCGKIWKETRNSLSQPHHIYYRAPGNAPFVNESREYQALTGACIMVRRSEFLSIGPFDEGYENGWEDDDLCYAYRATGKRSWYCSESTVIHHESKSLNEKIEEAEERLAAHRNATPGNGNDRLETERELRLISDIEQQLLGVRERFLKNRRRFLSKWKECIVRDDFEFYRRDGIPFVSIIIPLFNRLDFTEKCLEALFRNTPEGSYELIIVDNGSTDATADFLKKHERISLVVSNPKNLGFAKACNQGAEAAHGEYLVFLNNDTEPQPGWLDALVRVIHADPSIGAVGGKLLFPDGTIQHAGVLIVDDKISNDPLLGIHIFYGKQNDLPNANIPFCYQALTAAALMVRRSAFFEAGRFDECYWNGYEDVDLCFALGEKGNLLVYTPESVIIHHESKSGPERFAKAGQNILRLHEKWLGKIIPDFTITDGGSSLEPEKAAIFPYTGPGSTPRTKAQKQTSLVSIVILTFNQLDKTRDCIESIRKHTPKPHEIIFIDNGSTDGTVAWLKEIRACNDSYSLIENGENRGFAAGCNQGIEAARGEYVLLLNNDVVVTKDWLAGLLECLHASPDAGVVGPMTNNISGIQQLPDAHYSSPAELDAFAAKFRHNNRHRRIPYRRIVGFCMLFRKTLSNEIGLLDEGFGTGNFEDDDFCLRAAIAGYRNVIAGDVFIHHVGSASFRGNNLDYISSLSDTGAYFRDKWSRPVTDENEGKRIIALKTLEKAELLFQRGEHEKMIETVLQEGIRIVPDEKRFYLALAGYFLDLGRHKDAFDTLSELPESCKDEIRLVLTGLALAGMGRQSDALVLGNEAKRLNPCSPKVFYLLGVIADSLGQESHAKEYWENALSLDPGFGEACSALGKLELSKGFKENGLELLERGFLLSPLTTASGLRYHTAASDAGEFERAGKLFLEMHRIYPQHRTIHFLLIDLLIRQEKTVEALAEIEAACVTFGTEEGIVAAGLELRRTLGPIAVSSERMKSGTSVSLCMIVKNEQVNLPRCLKSLKPVIDEIIIVDTGSTDSTREIAELFGARLFEYPWNGDFSSARNVSLKHATGSWILVMDADEVLSEMDYPRFQRIVADSPPAGAAYDIVTRNYRTNIGLEKWQANDGMYPGEEAGAGWTPSNKVRLFPNREGLRFENPVHEMVDATLVAMNIPILQTEIPVHHYGCLDKSRQQRKGEDYYLLGRKKLEQSGGNDFRALCELAVQAGGIGRYQEAVDLWERVLMINPSYPLALFNLGYALLQLGRFHDSRAASAKAMELDPCLYEAVNNFAICEICVGSTEKAIRILEACLEKRPNDVNALVMLALARLCAGDKQAGHDIFQKLSAKGIDYAEFINEASKKLVVTGKKACAGELLKTAIFLGSGNHETVRLFREFGENT